MNVADKHLQALRGKFILTEVDNFFNDNYFSLICSLDVEYGIIYAMKYATLNQV